MSEVHYICKLSIHAIFKIYICFLTFHSYFKRSIYIVGVLTFSYYRLSNSRNNTWIRREVLKHHKLLGKPLYKKKFENPNEMNNSLEKHSLPILTSLKMENVHVLAIINNAAMHRGVHVSLWVSAFKFLRYISQKRDCWAIW